MAHFVENLPLAKSLLDWSSKIQIGVTPECRIQAHALAISMLEPLAASFEEGFVEALWLICMHSKDEGQAQAALILAAVHGHPEAVAECERCGLSEKVAAARFEFDNSGE